MSSKKNITIVAVLFTFLLGAGYGLWLRKDIEHEREWLSRVNGGTPFSDADVMKARLRDLSRSLTKEEATLPTTTGEATKTSPDAANKPAKEIGRVYNEKSVGTKDSEMLADTAARELAPGIFESGAEKNYKVMSERLAKMEKAGFPENVLSEMRKYVAAAERAAKVASVKPVGAAVDSGTVGNR